MSKRTRRRKRCRDYSRRRYIVLLPLTYNAFERSSCEMLVANVGLANVLLQFVSNPLAFRLSRRQSIDKSSNVMGKIMATVFGK